MDAAAPDAMTPLSDGSWTAPFTIDSVPFTYDGDTTRWPIAEASRYAPCAPMIDESGPEVVFTFVPAEDGVLVVAVDDQPADAVDIDVHLLEQPDASSCVTRANVSLRHPVAAGTQIWIVADTWHDGTRALVGEFRLTVELEPSPTGACPSDMSAIEGFCMDRYEAPNIVGRPPLVMYHFYEAEAWCAARGKRLCFDDEWTLACATAAGWPYPYGAGHQSGVCNDDEIWRQYSGALLGAWPRGVSTPGVDDVDALFHAVELTVPATAEHARWLYQGEAAGDNPGCTNALGVFDLVGNVEEWTRRRDGGDGRDFSGNLKGRYWAEPRTCQSGVRTHGNAFRFYEIGFRCCRDRTR